MIKLKRDGFHAYRYGRYQIIKDVPQPDCGIGYVSGGRYAWNIYEDGDDDPLARFSYLSEVKEWLEKNE